MCTTGLSKKQRRDKAMFFEWWMIAGIALLAYAAGQEEGY